MFDNYEKLTEFIPKKQNIPPTITTSVILQEESSKISNSIEERPNSKEMKETPSEEVKLEPQKSGRNRRQTRRTNRSLSTNKMPQ